MRVFLYSLLGLFGVLILFFGLNYFGLMSFRFFAPKYENARREVYECTQSYIEGKRQSLTKHYSEWRKSETDEKSAIRFIVLQEFANFDTDKLTIQQRGWYNEIIK